MMPRKIKMLPPLTPQPLTTSKIDEDYFEFIEQELAKLESPEQITAVRTAFGLDVTDSIVIPEGLKDAKPRKAQKPRQLKAKQPVKEATREYIVDVSCNAIVTESISVKDEHSSNIEVVLSALIRTREELKRVSSALSEIKKLIAGIPR